MSHAGVSTIVALNSALREETSFSLAVPVGSLMRPSSHLEPEDSLDRAATELRRSGNGMIPIVRDSKVIGMVTETSLALALANVVHPSSPITDAMVPAPLIQPYAPAAEALRLFADGSESTLLVVDDEHRLMGLISPSDLYPRRRVPPRPALVGGMATPFGVYLTNGVVGAGAGGFALVATGMLMYAMLAAASLISFPIVDWLQAKHLQVDLLNFLAAALPILLFMAGMRLIPLSGTHAAEHQVVHAIERGEELRPEIVRRMPRVHPRCGTNLAVGATMFLSIFFSEWVSSGEIRFIVAALVTFLFWRRLGSLVQQFITTKRANQRQIEGGIRAGQELLDRFARSNVSVPSIPLRLWRSGMLHVMAGSFLCLGLLFAIDYFLFAVWKVHLPL